VAVVARNSRRERRWRNGGPQDGAGDEAAERSCFRIPAAPGHPEMRCVQQESQERRAKRSSNPAAFSTAKIAPLGDLTADSEADWHSPHERHHAELASGHIRPFIDGRRRDSPATPAKQDKIRR